MSPFVKSILPFVIAVGLPILALFSMPVDLLPDEAAINLKYIDNIVSHNGYRYNAADKDPVLGSSSFVFTFIAAFLKFTRGFDEDFMYVRFPGMVGYAAVLWIAFLTGRSSGGAIPGLIALCYVVCYPGYFYYSVSGLETLAAGAVSVLIYYLFYFEKRLRLFYVLCATLVFVKLEYLFVTLFLVVCQSFLQAKAGNGFRRWLLEPLYLYFAPCFVFFVFCWIYFGSPIPSSFMANVLLDPAPDGLRYLRYLLTITKPASFILLLSLPSLLLLMVVSYWRRELPSIRFMLIASASLILLTQLSLMPLREVFLRHFVVPVLAFQFTVIFAAIEVVRLSDGRLKRGVGLFYASATVLQVVAFFTPLFSNVENFVQDLNHQRSSLSQIEIERREFGELLKQKGSTRDTLLTDLGWPAYDSGMFVVDPTGVNTPSALGLGPRKRLQQSIKAFDPEFLLINKVRSPFVLTRYELLAVGHGIREFSNARLPELELYRKREKKLPVSGIIFLNLDLARKISARTRDGQTVQRITSSDYILYPNQHGSRKYSIEFEELNLRNVVIGAYCYVENPMAPPVDFVMEATLSNGQTVSNRIQMTHESGMSFLSLQISGSDLRGSLVIYTETRSPHGLARAHVRDVFMANVDDSNEGSGFKSRTTSNQGSAHPLELTRTN